ncbi:hypothetical protein [Ramlibacter sp.]|uniref:hypothetical protein n=1 Tax=Ramlibacter sp. TaxID=1917967 RepID=UPI002B747244|nr:hypothetical protein [Ramlibacter sp.]HWI83249.1 hypothetical protein [Ramlibacter sp.]
MTDAASLELLIRAAEQRLFVAVVRRDDPARTRARRDIAKLRRQLPLARTAAATARGAGEAQPNA